MHNQQQIHEPQGNDDMQALLGEEPKGGATATATQLGYVYEFCFLQKRCFNAGLELSWRRDLCSAPSSLQPNICNVSEYQKYHVSTEWSHIGFHTQKQSTCKNHLI